MRTNEERAEAVRDWVKTWCPSNWTHTDPLHSLRSVLEWHMDRLAQLEERVDQLMIGKRDIAAKACLAGHITAAKRALYDTQHTAVNPKDGSDIIKLLMDIENIIQKDP